jgi:hypothetical protein
LLREALIRGFGEGIAIPAALATVKPDKAIKLAKSRLGKVAKIYPDVGTTTKLQKQSRGRQLSRRT